MQVCHLNPIGNVQSSKMFGPHIGSCASGPIIIFGRLASFVPCTLFLKTSSVLRAYYFGYTIGTISFFISKQKIFIEIIYASLVGCFF